MKAAWYERNGPAREVLVVGEWDTPSPGAGEVLVRIHASGVNPSDVKSRAGRPLVGPRVIPHSDGAGVIVDVGPGVPRERVGERVWLWNGQWKRPMGTAAEFIAVPQHQAVHLPDGTGFEEGACLGIPALTALNALTTDGPVWGQTVLVAGGAGAVGAYAVQFAKLLGAGQVVATVSSDEKAALARAYGADHTINYREGRLVEAVRELTGGRGIDRIIEVDAAANIKDLPQIVARDGLCVVYGSGAPDIPVPFGPMILIGAAMRFFVVYELTPPVRDRLVASLNAYLQAQRLQHSVAARYPLDQIAAAHEAVESGKVVGNVVLTLQPSGPSA
ncbi:NADPH:quinone reductase [Ideonella sp. DXS29W]|uniref:NADPH:quinone reductase n=1 Tax=Ideonella lacteola TaxID=2984193 RepID=A0ABU9BS74_9BURK